MNVVQYPDGSLPPESARLLDDLAAWFAVNGEAIYATRPWQVFGEGPTKAGSGHFNENFAFTARDIRFTQSKDGATLYAIVMGWPEDGDVSIRSLARRDGPSQDSIKEVSLLGYDGKLEWHQTADAYWQPCRTRIPLRILLSCGSVA